MTTRNAEEKNGCVFRWKIGNVSRCCWLKKGEKIKSPTFNASMGTKWSLELDLFKIENFICLDLHREEYCSGPNVIEFNFQLAFVGKDDSILKERTWKSNFAKNRTWGYSSFEDNLRMLLTGKEEFIPENTLTVQCKIWKTEEVPVKLDHVFGQTLINDIQKSFLWRIGDVSTIETNARYKFKDTLLDFNLILNANLNRIDIDMISFHNSVKYISFDVFVTDSDGRQEKCGFQHDVNNLLNEEVSLLLYIPQKFLKDKSRYFPVDVRTLYVEFTFSTIEYHCFEMNSANFENDGLKLSESSVGEGKSQLNTVLTDDFKSLYEEGIFYDTELRTATKTFPAHRGILSSRSPVLRRMFSNDMKEANSGHVKIVDFENETIHRMLLYIYTDTIDDLQFESACDLYKIADKYEILSLKSRCSSFLKDDLCPTKVCDVVSLADLHQDGDLKNAAQAYILEHTEVFSSLEWKSFMDNNIKLAADIMYKKVNPNY